MWVRRRISVVVAFGVLALAAIAVLLASAPSRGALVRCGPVSAHTLAAGGAARIYAVGDDVYGCASGGAHPYKLGGRGSCIGASRVGPAATVAGKLAAYGLTRCGVDTGFTEVIVRRLTDGAQLRALPATSRLGPESFQWVASLVLRSDGGVAWIATGSSVGARRTLIEVRKADHRGAALLDSGPAIDSRSLRLHGSKLTWRDGNNTRTATLQ